MKHLSFLLLLLIIALPATASTKKKYPGARQYVYRLSLADKKGTPYELQRPQRWLSHKSIERRRRQGLEVDSTDLPVSPSYLKILRTLKNTQIVGTSRWLNTVLLCTQDTTLLSNIREMEFIRQAELVWTSPDSLEPYVKWKYHEQFNTWDSVRGERYGNAKEQIESLQGHRLHSINLRGRGMTIAVIDGGFRNVHMIPALRKAHIAGVRDFVIPIPKQSDDINCVPRLYFKTDHGTKVFSALAANAPQVLKGSATEATYWLLCSEDQQSEQIIEEDYWVMAAEFADSVGVDIINSSLGYNEFDNPAQNHRLRDLDGNSSVISRAASMLAHKGIILVNSAGNNGMGPWKKICVPADAHDILTVGALNLQMRNAPFSSVGPTQDGRVKPDVMAIGSPAALITGRGTIIHDMGTSFATPLVCGLTACLWQALPDKTAMDIIELIRQTSDNYATPDNIYGYGRPNFWRAYMIGKASPSPSQGGNVKASPGPYQGGGDR